MEKKPVMWDRNEVPLNLRPPKVALQIVLNSLQLNLHSGTKVNIQETVEENSDVDKLVSNSKFKVEAPEWVSSENTSEHRIEDIASSVKNQLKINEGNENKDSTEFDLPDLPLFKQIITTLTKDPGQFHNLLELFLKTLVPYFDDLMALSTIVKILVKQAINDANFRYTGARLCRHIEEDCPQIIGEVTKVCMIQLEINSTMRNVLLFIAELFTQPPHHSVYESLLIDSFILSFDEGGDENIKCICQALKLTGYILEQSYKYDLDTVFNKLESLKGTVEGSASTLLDTVFNLRSSNWGQSSDVSENDQEFDRFVSDAEGEALTHEESQFIAAHMQSDDDILSVQKIASHDQKHIPVKNVEMPDSQYVWHHISETSSDVSENDQEFDSFVSDEEQFTIFFNEEGVALTHEESQFIAAHMQSNDDILCDSSDDADELYDPEDEMDEEIREGFREFLKLSSSKN